VNYAALRYVIERCSAKGAAWAVLVVIAYRADRDTGECYVSRRRLAKEARVSTATVHRVLGELFDVGELAIVLSGSGRRATCYRIVVYDGPSGSVSEPQAKPVVAHLAQRSGSPDGPVVAHLGEASIGGREEREGVEGARGSGSAADAAVAARSGDADADHAAYLAALGYSEGSA